MKFNLQKHYKDLTEALEEASTVPSVAGIKHCPYLSILLIKIFKCFTTPIPI